MTSSESIQITAQAEEKAGPTQTLHFKTALTATYFLHCSRLWTRTTGPGLTTGLGLWDRDYRTKYGTGTNYGTGTMGPGLRDRD